MLQSPPSHALTHQPSPVHLPGSLVTSLTEHPWIQPTQCLDFLSPTLNSKLNFRNFSHLNGVHVSPRTHTHENNRTKLVVFAFSSGVFSNRRCAARILRSHSSTNVKMFDSYSIWNRLNIMSLGLASFAAKYSVLRRSVCDFGHAPRSIFCSTTRVSENNTEISMRYVLYW